MFRKDGSVVLTDFDDAIIWSTNTSSTRAQQMKLLDSGNLVVIDADGKTVLWQSFDSPTDTLLPTQPITKNIKVVSSRAKGCNSSGYYGLYFDTDNVLLLVYDGPDISSIYWPDPEPKITIYEKGRTNYNNSKHAVLGDEGKFVSSDGFSFNASDEGHGIRRRLTLDYDGNLRLYSLNGSTGNWYITWEAFLVLCKIHGLCGRNGICVHAPVPQCSCPPGYEMTNTSDWGKGCKPKTVISCSHRQQYRYLELPSTDYWGYDLNFTPSISWETCRDICSTDCHCRAFGYKKGTGRCYPKNDLFNGRTIPGLVINIYLKVPIHMNSPFSPVSQGHRTICNSSNGEVVAASSVIYRISSTKFKWTYYLFWFVGAFFVIEVLFITFGCWFILTKGRVPTSVEEGYKMVSSQFRRFTYKDLERATGKFKDELGKGGSGSVYKGVLDDERVVAVKKLQDAIRGEEEFWAEVRVIGRIYHMNLVRMWGFCSERAHKLLVSEFVENGSLDKFLFDGTSNTSVLGWRERYKIALGVAKGLAYLHHECLEWVIHCDVKPENILLDREFEPKIADFGLAKLLKRGGGSSSLSHIRGTRGYIAPEWASSNLPITGKVDVYSYGVVLLEIVKGSRASDWEMDFRRLCLVLKERCEGGEESWIGNFVDCRLNGEFSCKQALLMVELAVACLEEEVSRRPTMDSVLRLLLSCDDISDS